VEQWLKLGLRPLPSASIVVPYLLIIISLDAIQSELLTALLNQVRINKNERDLFHIVVCKLLCDEPFIRKTENILLELRFGPIKMLKMKFACKPCGAEYEH
jgi:hypothetical protein